MANKTEISVAAVAWKILYNILDLEAPKYKCEAPIIGGLGTEPPAGSRGKVANLPTFKKLRNVRTK